MTTRSKHRRTAIEWARANLFSSWGNAVLTLLSLTAIAFVWVVAVQLPPASTLPPPVGAASSAWSI